MNTPSSLKKTVRFHVSFEIEVEIPNKEPEPKDLTVEVEAIVDEILGEAFGESSEECESDEDGNMYPIHFIGLISLKRESASPLAPPQAGL